MPPETSSLTWRWRCQRPRRGKGTRVLQTGLETGLQGASSGSTLYEPATSHHRRSSTLWRHQQLNKLSSTDPCLPRQDRRVEPDPSQRPVRVVAGPAPPTEDSQDQDLRPQPPLRRAPPTASPSLTLIRAQQRPNANLQQTPTTVDHHQLR